MAGMTKRRHSDGYERIAPKPTTRKVHRPLAPDVYPYRNGRSRVNLCISCAVHRRMDGRSVEMDGGRVRERCGDCEKG